MRIANRWILAGLAIFLLVCGEAAIPALQAEDSSGNKTSGTLKNVLESNVKTEWEAFKNRDKRVYTDLLAEDFVAVEDDGGGTRTKAAIADEIERSMITSYALFAFNVVPLGADAALVTYELTMQFPPKSQIRLKRVLVSEVWVRHDQKWKARYYQETHVR